METNEAAPTLAIAKGTKKQVQFTLTKEVKAAHIHDLLDRLFREAGCLACGLGGIDLRLIREDLILVNPVRPLEQFKNLPGVKNATIGG